MVISGKFAEVLVDSCNILEFESVDLTYGSNVQEYNARSGGGSTMTVDGVNSGSGTINGFLDPDDPLTVQLTSGALVTITISESQGSTTLATGQARLGQFGLPTVSRGGEPVRVTIPFITHGPWSFSS